MIDFTNSFWSWEKNMIEPCSGISLADRGFRYGQHLFETVAVRNGEVLFFEEHWVRLIAAAERHRFPVDDLWYESVSDFFKKEFSEEGVVRIFLTAGEGAPLAPITKPQLFLFWENVDFPSKEKLKTGINIVSLHCPIATTSWGEKTGNYWEHIKALETARERGAEEGLVFDAESFLVSATMANVILWMDDGKVVTPPRARGARDGVMLAQARKELPNLMEGDVSREDLKKVVAMAITNSRCGVMPVAKLDGRKLTSKEESRRSAD